MVVSLLYCRSPSNRETTDQERVDQFVLLIRALNSVGGMKTEPAHADYVQTKKKKTTNAYALVYKYMDSVRSVCWIYI